MERSQWTQMNRKSTDLFKKKTQFKKKRFFFLKQVSIFSVHLRSLNPFHFSVGYAFISNFSPNFTKKTFDFMINFQKYAAIYFLIYSLYSSIVR